MDKKKIRNQNLDLLESNTRLLVKVLDEGVDPLIKLEVLNKVNQNISFIEKGLGHDYVQENLKDLKDDIDKRIGKLQDKKFIAKVVDSISDFLAGLNKFTKI